MEIINMPIAEYLKTCKKVAYQRGFVWIMVLLARERDACIPITISNDTGTLLMT